METYRKIIMCTAFFVLIFFFFCLLFNLEKFVMSFALILIAPVLKECSHYICLLRE